MSILNNSSDNDGLLTFLQCNPSLSSYFLTKGEKAIQEVTTIIEPVFQASQRCEANFFIQAISLGSTGFLATNLSSRRQDGILATDLASSWSVGRGGTCAINIRVQSISRCHAVITYHPSKGFALMDLGSKNGSWVNNDRVVPHTQYVLGDGDLLRFGTLQVELFVSDCYGELPGQHATDDGMTTIPGSLL